MNRQFLKLLEEAQRAVTNPSPYTWLDDLNCSQAYLACIGAGPWKINRRRTIQKQALRALGSRDLRDATGITFPLEWQNQYLTRVQQHLAKTHQSMERFCLTATREDVFRASGAPHGTKVLSLFCRDKLRVPAFPVDRHVRRLLTAHELPTKEDDLLRLCTETGQDPLLAATLLIRFASGDLTGDLNPKDLIEHNGS